MACLGGHLLMVAIFLRCRLPAGLNLPSRTYLEQVGGSWSFSTSFSRLYISRALTLMKDFGHSFFGTTLKVNLWDLKLPANFSQYCIVIFSHIWVLTSKDILSSWYSPDTRSIPKGLSYHLVHVVRYCSSWRDRLWRQNAWLWILVLLLTSSLTLDNV